MNLNLKSSLVGKCVIQQEMPEHPGRLSDGKQTHPSSETSAEERGCLVDKGGLNFLECRPMLPLRCMYRGPEGSCRGSAWG